MVDLEKLLLPADTQPVDVVYKLWLDYADGKWTRIASASDIDVLRGIGARVAAEHLARNPRHSVVIPCCEDGTPVDCSVFLIGCDGKPAGNLHIDTVSARPQHPGDIRRPNPNRV